MRIASESARMHVLGAEAAQRLVSPCHLSHLMPNLNVGLCKDFGQRGAPLQALAAHEVLEEVRSSGGHLRRATRAVLK